MIELLADLLRSSPRMDAADFADQREAEVVIVQTLDEVLHPRGVHHLAEESFPYG